MSPSFKDAVALTAKAKGKSTMPEPVARVADRMIDGAAGPIPVRVYWPAKTSSSMPGIVYYHGGGFVIADLDVSDASPRALANAAHAVVVSVHYRQAPEYPYPASHDDAQAAFQYVATHAADFGLDARRIAVAGESAGGNLATVVTMRQKRDGRPLPVFQLLVYQQ